MVHEVALDLQDLWTTCQASLQGQVSEAVWRSTFQDVAALDLEGSVLRLAVPSAVVKDRVETRYLSLVEDIARHAFGEGLTIELAVLPGAAVPATFEDPLDALLGSAPETVSPELSDAALGGVTRAPSPVEDNRLTFEAFVIGPSNRFAHAAALAVAETPGRSYNPLFIYGDAGLGKTHLLHAIRHYVEEMYPDYVVRYVTSEEFLNQFIESIRHKTSAEFKRRYRDVDVLLVDDIQFLENRKETQEEFFHTFNSLHGGGRQLVLSSDRPPDAISTLENRLRSRFMMGLTTDIQPPDLETRLAIIRKKAEREKVPIPDDVLEFIATNITDNIRELEGALNRVSALANLDKEPLTLEKAERHLQDILGDRQPRPITPQVILEATAAMFDFTVDELKGKSRQRPLVTARQIAMYVFRELTDLSYPSIAKEFGGRDHTTVIHAVEKIKALMRERRQIYDQVTELVQQIRKGT
ncbi:MAG: chromosomal replication initiator protein DnaA [Microthrixaceae bacterium]|nr:chromosomal replication initiator protein DnaA [Acidimicrobiales bacterium]MCB9403233.1 chromosomal replication initiator protein DnaA [Microthrixaceae bacterium]